MINIIKNNKRLILICMILFVLGFTTITQYQKESKIAMTYYEKTYKECQEGLLEDNICIRYTEPLKKRDSVSTFGYITLVYNNINVLQIIAPLLIIFVALGKFHSYLRKGVLKNSMTRIGYKKCMQKMYIRAVMNVLILPIFLLILFIISCIISGNFDYMNGIKQYGFDAFGMENAKNWILFLGVYLLNFILHSIFWIHIGLYNCKHNKNGIIAIIVSYIEYLMIFIIFELVFSNTIFYGTQYMEYFCLSNIWAYSNVTLEGVTMFSFMLAFLSGLVVYIAYKDKEKVLVEIEK